jgi:hypothetical protein
VHPTQVSPRLIQVPNLDAEMHALREYEIEQGRAMNSAASLDSPFSL